METVPFRREQRVVYLDGEDTRSLQGLVSFSPDGVFVIVTRRDGEYRFNRSVVLRIEPATNGGR